MSQGQRFHRNKNLGMAIIYTAVLVQFLEFHHWKYYPLSIWIWYLGIMGSLDLFLGACYALLVKFGQKDLLAQHEITKEEAVAFLKIQFTSSIFPVVIVTSLVVYLLMSYSLEFLTVAAIILQIGYHIQQLLFSERDLDLMLSFRYKLFQQSA